MRKIKSFLFISLLCALPIILSAQNSIGLRVNYEISNLKQYPDMFTKSFSHLTTYAEGSILCTYRQHIKNGWFTEYTGGVRFGSTDKEYSEPLSGLERLTYTNVVIGIGWYKKRKVWNHHFGITLERAFEELHPDISIEPYINGYAGFDVEIFKNLELSGIVNFGITEFARINDRFGELGLKARRISFELGLGYRFISAKDE